MGESRAAECAQRRMLQEAALEVAAASSMDGRERTRMLVEWVLAGEFGPFAQAAGLRIVSDMKAVGCHGLTLTPTSLSRLTPTLGQIK